MAGVAPTALLALALGTAGCFSPTYERPTCVVDGVCPDGLTCEAGQCVATPLCEPTDDLVLCMSFNDGRAVNAGRGPQPDVVRGFPQAGATPGPVGAAARFDGDAVIHLPDDPRLDVTSFTLEAFVRFEQVPRPGQPVGLLDNDAQYGLLLRPAPNCPDDGQRYLACDVGGDSLCLPLSPLAGSSESLASFATRWHHLACTYEGDVSTLSIYFDGAFAGSRATRVVNTSATNGLTIGQDGDLVAGAILDPLVGDLDELRLWRTVRTAEQLRAAAARGE